jgi:hypothetical protein
MRSLFLGREILAMRAIQFFMQSSPALYGKWGTTF